MKKKDIKTTLDTIAGYEEEKEEITKIIRLLNNYEKYEKIGIDIPKGLILQGPAGTGKTLMAKAIAGECNIPFFYFQALDGVEKSLLDNLSKVFEEAYKNIPSIVYIDEIDKIVTNSDYNSDTSRAVLQYLLTQLDGAQSKKGVMVIASTNCYRNIPKALVRSGRMDKKILVDYPNLPSRIKIIKYYIQDKKIFSKLDVNNLAVKLNGMTGADIKTLVNNALIEYVDSKEYVLLDDFQKLIYEMNFETIGKNWNKGNTVTKMVYHEVGHALMGYYLDGKAGAITGVKYGDIQGFTESRLEELILDFDDDGISEAADKEEGQGNQTKKELLNSCIKCLGGIAAESIYYKEYDTGCMSDLSAFEKNIKRMSFCNFLGPKYNAGDVVWTDTTVDDFKKIRNRYYKKCLRIAKKIMRKYKLLGKYLTDEALNNNNCLSQELINKKIDYYMLHRKEIDATFKQIKGK